VVFLFLLIWLLPKFIKPTINTKECSSSNCDINSLDAITSQIFINNLDKMKNSAITYYTVERLPKEVGNSDEMTLSDMIGKKLIVALVDKNNKVCDLEKSYVKITKLDEEYILKVNLKDSEKEDYILVHLGCYSYCDTYICEKQETNIPVKSGKPATKIPIKSAVPAPLPSQKPQPTQTPSEVPTDTPSPKPSKDPEYLYEYKKSTNTSFSEWTLWSNWSRTSCNTQEINCSDSDPSCLTKIQIYKRKEKISTYQKAYAKTREVLKQIGSYRQKSCSKYNYIEINRTIYATTATNTYSQINSISTNATTTGNWVYSGRESYKNPPIDTAQTHYKFVGANYSYCGDTCETLPEYYYDSYTYVGGLSKVSSTTIPGNSSSSTTSSTSTTTQASCGEYIEKIIPIYGTITITEKAYRTEPLYGTVCYQSTKTRKLLSNGSTKTKWSTYGDKTLLDSGWYYTGEKRLK